MIYKTFDQMRNFMSDKSKTDSQVIQTGLKRNQTQEFQVFQAFQVIWSQSIMKVMMKILHFRAKTVVLNSSKKNMSYHIYAQLAHLKILKWENHTRLVRWNSTIKLSKQFNKKSLIFFFCILGMISLCPTYELLLKRYCFFKISKVYSTTEKKYSKLFFQMFLKPFRTKSSVTVRNSDRRKVKSRLGSFFPEMTEDQIGNLIPAKGDLKENKIYTHKGEGLSIFTFADEPVLIELSSGTLIPYLYSIWKLELILPTLYVPPYLLEKFSGGADLMAPGIIIPPGLGIDQTIEKHKAAIIKIIGQKHAVAVGYAEQSGAEMANGKLSGKAIKIVSVIGDQLWASGSKFVPPSEPDPIFEGKVIPVDDNDTEEDNPGDNEDGEAENGDENATEEVHEGETNEDVKETPENENDIDAPSPEQIRKEQDDLLEYTFKDWIYIF